jgi:hypothetical protein
MQDSLIFVVKPEVSYLQRNIAFNFSIFALIIEEYLDLYATYFEKLYPIYSIEFITEQEKNIKQ